ncbi:hypothetical protein, partial [Shigella boydii]|uniref:hypothetical protein n=1 Tax=Shigella boydii TaxID=621 RepID=UPI0019D49B9E
GHRALSEHKTLSVSWSHYLPFPIFSCGVIISAHLTIIKFNNKYRVCYDRIFLYPQEYALPYCL